MIFFWLFIVVVIVQRLSELIIAKRNERILVSKGAVEYDRKGYTYIVMMHVLFFISIVTEKLYFPKLDFLKLDFHSELNPFSPFLIILFLLAQALRYWAIFSLGIFWNTRIIILPGSSLIKKGPYRFLRHPNYIAVITELAVIPLIFSCYLTSVIFTVLNLVLLNRRIKIENNELRKL